ncbi:MAG: acyltransferase [Chitinophagaceae bacterium]|nr:MAG: acyltransferase [Chitinophagaceae bacterium]
MDSNASTRLPGLDHLRALAILLVFFYHYGHLFPHPQWTFDIGRFGWSGVDLFFVLSGYLIATGLFSEIKRTGKLSLSGFYSRRFWRIVPPFLFVVALYFLFPSLRERGAPAPLWKFLTFTQNIGLDLSQHGSFSHAWSLCIEEQFYALFPLLLLIFYRRAVKCGWWLWLLLVLGGIAVRYATWQIHLAPQLEAERFPFEWLKWIYYPTWCRLDGLLGGIAIAALRAFKKERFDRIVRQSNWLLLFGLAALTAAYFICYDQQTMAASVAGYPLVAFGYSLLLLGALAPQSILQRRSKITERVAILSYGLYLVHKFTIYGVQRILKGWIDEESNAMLLCCFFTCLLVAWLLHRLVERPAQQLREKLSIENRKPGQPSPLPSHLP